MPAQRFDIATLHRQDASAAAYRLSAYPGPAASLLALLTEIPVLHETEPNPYEPPLTAEALLEDVLPEEGGAPAHPATVPSAALFRGVAVASLICWYASIHISDSGPWYLSEGVAAARSWNYFESVLPYWALHLWWIVNAIATIVGVMGLLGFWRPARWILAGVIVGYVLMAPFLGLMVYAPLENTLGTAAWTMFAWLVTVSFWSPLARNFGVGDPEGPLRDQASADAAAG